MKRIFSTLIVVLISIATWSQNDTLLRGEFRTLAKDAFPELSAELNTVYIFMDSIALKNEKKFAVQLDSLRKDSLFMASGALPLLQLDEYFHMKMNLQKPQAMATLRLVLNGMETADTQSRFYLKLHEYMVETFKNESDFTSAFKAIERLSAANRNELESNLAVSNSRVDSLNLALDDKKAVLKRTEKLSAESKMIWMIVAGAAALLALIFLFVWIISRSSMRKQMKELSAKASDKTELEVLTKKVNDLKTEALEFKKTAQVTVDKLNTMDDSRRKTIVTLKDLATDINDGLDEMKAQCDNGKQTMSPATYMALQNAVTRMGNTIANRFQSLSEAMK